MWVLLAFASGAAPLRRLLVPWTPAAPLEAADVGAASAQPGALRDDLPASDAWAASRAEGAFAHRTVQPARPARAPGDRWAQRHWWRPGAGGLRGAAAALAAGFLFLGAAQVPSASAENELAQLAQEKSTAELVDTACFADKCKPSLEACGGNRDCLKGLACSAKCMGDAACNMGCFAKYDNPTLDAMLQCSIEDGGCIKIATEASGGDTAFNAPPPPHQSGLVPATPASMSGKWYKVLGFNPNYDCFDCQKNTFTHGKEARSILSEAASMDISPSTAAVEVEYTLPRERIGAPPDTFQSRLVEKLEFDTVPGAVRTAHTEGHMFGLTFWENWYVLGKNKAAEPEFRFIYYTGNTMLNRYNGAFVYARTPELPEKAMPSIYKIARDAGFEPTRACCVDNKCFAKEATETAQPPLFTEIAEAATLNGLVASDKVPQTPPDSVDDIFGSMRSMVRDVREFLEDPAPAGKKLIANQRTMNDLNLYDADGYRKPRSRGALDNSAELLSSIGQ